MLGIDRKRKKSEGKKNNQGKESRLADRRFPGAIFFASVSTTHLYQAALSWERFMQQPQVNI
jgi:hypothetical protein